MMHPKNSGRSRAYIARDIMALYPNKGENWIKDKAEEFLPGWFVGTNYSNDQKRKVLDMACEVARLKKGELKYNFG